MTFLVDTNLVSEWVKPEIDPRIVEWWHLVDEDRAFLSVVTLADSWAKIEKGQKK